MFETYDFIDKSKLVAMLRRNDKHSTLEEIHSKVRANIAYVGNINNNSQLFDAICALDYMGYDMNEYPQEMIDYIIALPNDHLPRRHRAYATHVGKIVRDILKRRDILRAYDVLLGEGIQFDIISILKDSVDLIVKKKYFNLFKLYYELCGKEACNEAARYGNLKFLEYASKYARKSTVRIAAQFGHLECLRYLCEVKNIKQLLAAEHAAFNGQLECLRYLSKNEWSAETVNCAALGGNLECLRYLCDNGCQIDVENAAQHAAHEGNLECLRYLCELERIDHWSDYILEYTIFHDKFTCFRYLIERGIPLSESILTVIRNNGRVEFLKYIFTNGISPYDEALLNETIDVYEEYSIYDDYRFGEGILTQCSICETYFIPRLT